MMIGLGSRVAFNGDATDDSGPGANEDDDASLVGVFGDVIGTAPHETGNSPGDELWSVRLPGGRVIHLWTEEATLDVR